MSDYMAIHTPVLMQEVMGFFNKHPGKSKFIDGTAGEGGHTKLLLETFPTSKVLMIDRDKAILDIALTRLSNYGSRIRGVNSNFSEISQMEVSSFLRMNMSMVYCLIWEYLLII